MSALFLQQLPLDCNAFLKMPQVKETTHSRTGPCRGTMSSLLELVLIGYQFTKVLG